MSKKWSAEEKSGHYIVLKKLYISENKTIKEVGKILGISQQAVFKRLEMLSIKTIRAKKLNYCNQRHDIKIPKKRSADLAEFFGIMLGDGKLSPTQIIVTLGDKEKSYVLYVQAKIKKIFGACPKISVRKLGYHDVYLGSVELSRWLKEEGLVYNKVKSQVSAPQWIFDKKEYCEAFLRGFFDTDGSIYALRYGIQISFTNMSLPLLKSLQKMLFALEYRASVISSSKIYITKKEDVMRFFKEIRPANQKHIERFGLLTSK